MSEHIDDGKPIPGWQEVRKADEVQLRCTACGHWLPTVHSIQDGGEMAGQQGFLEVTVWFRTVQAHHCKGSVGT